MQMVDSGKVDLDLDLDLDLDVNNYKNFNVRNPKYPDKPITIRILLSHSAGIGMNKSSWYYSYFEEVAYPYSHLLFGFSNLGYYNFPVRPAFLLKSTSEDLAKFLRSFFNEKSLITKGSKEKMFQIQKGIKPENWDKMGLSWQYKVVNGVEVIGHTGGFDGVARMLFYNEERDRSIILLMNDEWKTSFSYDRFMDENI